jgi:hypothetical protein
MGGILSMCGNCCGKNGEGGGGVGATGRDSYHTISGRVQPQPDPVSRPVP